MGKCLKEGEFLKHFCLRMRWPKFLTTFVILVRILVNIFSLHGRCSVASISVFFSRTGFITESLFRWFNVFPLGDDAFAWQIFRTKLYPLLKLNRPAKMCKLTQWGVKPTLNQWAKCNTLGFSQPTWISCLWYRCIQDFTVWIRSSLPLRD